VTDRLRIYRSGLIFRAKPILGVLALEGTSPTVTVEIITAMQNETEDGWDTAVAFTNMTNSNKWQKKRAGELLKYIRWEVTTLGGTNPVATFEIKGILRETS